MLMALIGTCCVEKVGNVCWLSFFYGQYQTTTQECGFASFRIVMLQ